MPVRGLLVPFHRPDGDRLHVRLVVDGATSDLVSDDTRRSTRSRPDDVPGVLVTATAAELVAARRGERELPSAAMRGPESQQARFRRIFGLGGAPARGADMAELEASAPLAWRAVDRPIGMFDSGFGGLTVARALIDLLPAEDLVYIGDTGRYPYGPKPLEDVRLYARQLAWSLVKDHDVKAVIVACNTAAAAGLDDLRGELPVPVLDVIAPGAAALVQTTRTGRVGVIGTVGTIASGAYLHAVDAAAAASGREVTLQSAACPGFVEFVERGLFDGDEVTVLAERLLAPLRAADVDALLLGCTHYPFLAGVIGEVMGRDVTLVSSADETAFAARRMIGELGLLCSDDARVGIHQFRSSGDVRAFRELGGRLLGPELNHTTPWAPPA